MDVLTQNFNWYKNNLVRLFEQYGPSYIVIKNKKVIGSYKNYSTAYHETLKTEKIGTFNIQSCLTGTNRDYTEYIY